MLTYLNRLQRRMRYKGFRESDPLLRKVVEATNAVHALHVETHYLACGDVTGRKQENSPAEVASRRAPGTYRV